MSKKTHQRELDRARAKRQADAYQRRQQRTRVVAIGLIMALAGAVVVAGALSSTGGDDTPEVTIDDPALTSEPTPDAADGVENASPCPLAVAAPVPTNQTWDTPPPMTIDPGATYTANVRTSCGSMQIELFAADAPLAVNNFVFLANAGYYAGVPFHRVIQNFMIQGGDPTGTGGGGPGYQFEDELESVAVHGMARGTLAMANAGPNTNGSQFFIVQGDASHLTTHTVFGRVVEGMDVVDDIVAVPAGGPSGDIAIDPVVIMEVTITQS